MHIWLKPTPRHLTPLLMVSAALFVALAFTGPSHSVAQDRPVEYNLIDVRLSPQTAPDRAPQDFPREILDQIVQVRPLFSLPPERLRQMKEVGEQRTGRPVPDLRQWVRLRVEPGTDLQELARRLMELDEVEIAEVVPPDSPPPSISPNDEPTAGSPASPARTTETPLLTEFQGYLYEAPDGINAEILWEVPGGNGVGVKIIDIEYNWNQTHEDLTKAAGVSILMPAGHTHRDPFEENFVGENHGTAVLGELIADNNHFGVTGISWGADIGMAAQATLDADNQNYDAQADAIALAVNDTQVGDIILLETQTTVCGLPGPCTGGNCGPSEWRQSIFDATLAATSLGRIVVAAAGNGGVDLDQEGCEDRFDRNNRDSGAIIVGAGGWSGGDDRERLWFSSYGSRLDLQGWGERVMTTGYGTGANGWVDPDDPNNRDRWYRSTFDGTSSASPIVAGAIANIQAIRKQHGLPVMTPDEVRDLLIDTGSPQLGDTDEHIGPRPNLLAAVAFMDINVPPIADAGADRTIECTSFDGAVVTLDGSGSWDANEDALTYTWYDGATIVAGPTNQAMVNVTLPLGTHDLTLVVSDGQYEDEDEVRIRVRDTTPPVITLIGDASMTLECGIDEYDEPGATVADICDPNPSLVIAGNVDTATPGTYQITYNSSDASGNNAIQKTRTVEVEDTLPPEITILSDPMSLWPPNHFYHTVALDRLDFTVEDACDLTLTPDDVVVPVASSDEEENAQGQGDGDTYDDIVIAETCREVDVRAERHGRGDGRVYTLTLKVADASDNVGEADYEVHVPHNAMLGPWAINSGPVYVVERAECEPAAPAAAIATADALSTTAADGAVSASRPGDEGGAAAEPLVWALEVNHPNPLSATSTITFSVAEATHAVLALYDVRGAEVARLVDESVEAGRHTVVLDASALPSGVYVYRLMTPAFTEARTLTIAR